MTIDQIIHVYAFLGALATGFFFRYASTHPETDAIQWLARWLSSWWMSARWSGETIDRLNRMSWIAFAVAIGLFVMFFLDVPMRSQRLEF